MNLLPVLDDFDRMIDHHDEDGSCSLEGIQLIYQKMKKVLLDEKLEQIPSVGEPFNPEYHEAVGVEVTSEGQDNIILEEWQKGYTFNGRLLRPSRVKVGKFVETKSDS
jgi:molecular chaperone GrpE (heat shock protein)